jgi:hypothetical protein
MALPVACDFLDVVNLTPFGHSGASARREYYRRVENTIFPETTMTRLEAEIHAAIDEQGEAFERYQRGFFKVLPQWADTPRGSGLPDMGDLDDWERALQVWEASKKRTADLLAKWRSGG